MLPLLMSLLSLALHIAVIIFIAFVILWLLKLFGVGVDGDVIKVGKIIVVLLIIMAIIAWLAGFPLPFSSRIY